MFRCVTNVAEIVDRQVGAYNAHDIDAFAACYAEDVVILDAAGTELTRGRDQLVEQYGRWFRRNRGLHADVVARMEIGQFVIDHEQLSGTPDGGTEAVAIYRVSDAVAIYRVSDAGLIDRVQFLP
jgi:hypothetical protein